MVNDITAPADMNEKLRALEAARLQIEKQYGQGSLMKLGTHTDVAGIDVIPSGSILLDEALGIGGYPRGRIIEMYGPESSGKTTLALHAIAEAQKLGGIAAFIDAEHALDPVYAKNLGVNIDDLWVSQPDTGEQALEIADSLVRSGAVDIIVVDSVAALTPQAEIEGDMGDSHMGLQARLMSQALRKLTATIGKSRCLLVFIAPPFRKVELDIYFGKGVSAVASLLDAAVKYGFIDKKGAWYTTETEKIGQGRENAIAFLEQNTDFAREVEQKLREKLFPGQTLKNPKEEKDAAGKKGGGKTSDKNQSADNSATADEQNGPDELF